MKTINFSLGCEDPIKRQCERSRHQAKMDSENCPEFHSRGFFKIYLSTTCKKILAAKVKSAADEKVESIGILKVVAKFLPLEKNRLISLVLMGPIGLLQAAEETSRARERSGEVSAGRCRSHLLICCR